MIPPRLMALPMPQPSPKPSSTFLPKLPYLPRDPKKYRPKIGLIGCGGITSYHLEAYRSAKYEVAAFCDINLQAAKDRRDEFYPDAKVFADHRELLKLDEIEVVDITTHPEVRNPIVEDALRAGKHVLSQKPFVLDLDEGQRLVDLADQQGVLLAVNQNGRWSPHFSYIREAVRAGLLGDIVGVHCGVHWDHSWVQGTEFEKVYHLILYDFAIHWFDFVATLFPDHPAERVYASVTRSANQEIMPPLVAQATIEYRNAQGSLIFDANVPEGDWEQVVVSGSRGVIRSSGYDNNTQQVEFRTSEGTFSPKLEGKWFPDGFHGTMGELLCAIEEKRQPTHSARNNLRSLELCFAAVESSLRHVPIVPGTVRKLPESS